MSGSASMYSLSGLAVAGVSAAAAAMLARRERTYLPRGHASRIDTCGDPLGRALRYGCAGLTVGVEVGADGRLRLAPANGRTATAGAATARRDRAVTGPTGDTDRAGRDGAGRDGAGRDGAGRNGAGRNGAGRNGAGRNGAGQDGAGRTRAARDGEYGDSAEPSASAVAVRDPFTADPAAPRDLDRAISRLVLDPLHARIMAKGRIHSAQHQPFTVVLEPADGVPVARVLDVLEDELVGYTDMLTRCVAGTVRYAPVLVALAGAPRAVLTARDSRLFFAEGTLADVDRRVPTAAVPLVGEHVAWRLGWDGRGEMPGEERHMLRALVATAHAEGKRVRLFGVPENRRAVRRAFWRELHAAGADLIAARDLGSLRRLLRAQRAHR
jgi:hypothetical protein